MIKNVSPSHRSQKTGPTLCPSGTSSRYANRSAGGSTVSAESFLALFFDEKLKGFVTNLSFFFSIFTFSADQDRVPDPEVVSIGLAVAATPVHQSAQQRVQDVLVRHAVETLAVFQSHRNHVTFPAANPLTGLSRVRLVIAVRVANLALVRVTMTKNVQTNTFPMIIL